MEEVPTAWIETPWQTRVELSQICTIGRRLAQPQNTIEIDVNHVSRAHALILRQGEGDYLLFDRGSRDGTFLNGGLLTSPTLLRDGDRVVIGDHSFIFRQPGQNKRSENAIDPGIVTTRQRFRNESRWLLQADLAGFTSYSAGRAPVDVAQTVWPWYEKAKALIDAQSGVVNKLIGDSLLATFHDLTPLEKIAVAVVELHSLPGAAQLGVKVVLHWGEIAAGGSVLGGEEILADSINFLSRMEKLAGHLGLSCLVSHPARERLKDALDLDLVPGEHKLSGVPGSHVFHALRSLGH